MPLRDIMRAMDYSVFVCLCSACLIANQFGAVSSDERLECTQTVCKRKKEFLKCTAALILVTNVTSSTGEQDDVMLRNVKRACMGKRSCNANSVACKRRDRHPKTVSYLCVQDSPKDRSCPGSPVMLSEPHGFLKSPDYPAASKYRACHWRIEPRPRAAVHLTLHDLASTHRRQGVCDGGLQIAAYRCDPPKQFYTELLCANDSLVGRRDDQLTIVSCGPVDVTLTPARHSYPLRFWLGYSVKDASLRSDPVSRSLWTAGLLTQCPRVRTSDRVVPSDRVVTTFSVTMTTHNNQSVTSASGVSDDGGHSEQDSTMTVLIALVCVIGLIAISLTIALVVVCLKRRRPKVELIEHVYAVPGSSTCQTLSHTYLGDNPPEPSPRPHFVEPYSDVADARPVDQPPQATPTSPAYAEVEETCDSDADDKIIRRFQFRFRKRPSVSSSGTSAHYEDVNPLPTNVASSSESKNPSATTATSGGVSRNSAPSKHAAVSPRTANAPESQYSSNSISSDGGYFSTSRTNRVGRDVARDKLNKTSNDVSEAPVYVHVMDNADVRSDTKTTRLASNSRTHSDKSTVAPLAAKFSGNTDSGSSKVKAGSRGKTDVYPSRLYPLQEGRVASLVSTLNRTKEAKTGVTCNEPNKVS